MDTKIAAALNSLNLNSQQKKVLNEVLDNKFRYIDANSINIDSTYIELDDDYEGDEYYKYTTQNHIYFDDKTYNGLILESNYKKEEQYYISDNELEYYIYKIDSKIYLNETGTIKIEYYDRDSYGYIRASNQIYPYSIYANIRNFDSASNFGYKTSIKWSDNYNNNYFTYNYAKIKDDIDNKIVYNFYVLISTHIILNFSDKEKGYVTFRLDYNNFVYNFTSPISKETSDLIVNSNCSKGLYFSGATSSEQYQLGYNFTKNQIVAFGANSSLGILKGTGLTFTMTFDNDIFSINYNHANDKMSINTNIYAKDFVIEDESNTISVKDTIQDIYNKINNNDNDNGSDIIQSFIDREIEDLIYETAEIRSKDIEYFTGEEFKELVISEKEYNKYNYTWDDNSVHNNLDGQYNKIVVYKDILTKTINITNSNGEQEEINVLIVE